MTKRVMFSPPGWTKNLRPQAVKVLMAAKRTQLGVKISHINLSAKGMSVELEGPDAVTIQRAQLELQWRLDDAWRS